MLMYRGGIWLENRNKKPEQRGDYRQRYSYKDLMEVDGVSYRQRQNLTTILLMGIDMFSEKQSEGYRNGGQADFLRLLVLDSEEKTFSQLQIDRDTMTPITILGVLGNKSGVRTAQICLSHGFGDGKEQSCELTVEAVSGLLQGTPIDFYIAMNLDGIPALNDWAGGVTVTLEEDFSEVDPQMTKGTTLTLHGKQAETFVRRRKDIGAGTNEARMARQQQYITQLLDQIGEKSGEMGELYDTIRPYITTNMNLGQLINELWAAREYKRADVLKLEGVYQVGTDGFMQMIPDETSIRKAMIQLFYKELK